MYTYMYVALINNVTIVELLQNVTLSTSIYVQAHHSVDSRSTFEFPMIR
jgi:hypothetical protein